MRIRLATDFIDYYDHFFDVTDTELTFSRKTTDGPNRIEALVMLQAMGFKVPNHGLVRDIYDNMVGGMQQDPALAQKFAQDFKVVVYTDLKAHCGEGKEKLGLLEAYEKYPDCFATQHIKYTRSDLAVSVRLLVVGSKKYYLEYESKNDWRSNAGDVEIRYLNVAEKDSHQVEHIKIPLYAIDFVPVGAYNKEMYAVDFNVAPGIKGTPVQDLLKPAMAADLIQQRIQELHEEAVAATPV